ncbi:hypothetical protein NQ314_014128 [Rhamnusium bicolor]|uniref:SHSP domain-containing protein n=1 Tax=Rhamnusium bicolor TaxID=1586634 RepID=A0AAV8X421_9CUCU|nr:hypothetical protein NQ314_014128 [Rhamnusium bicolor]
MSLLPYLFEDYYLRPSRILDQHFGLALDPDDLLQPLTIPTMLLRSPAGYIRNWRSSASQQDSGSTVSIADDKFQANLDVQQFKPEEISVKITGGNTITIEGKHEEKSDEHGQIYRHFIRRYVLPKDCDMNQIESKLSSDGVLTIYAPRTDTTAIEQKNVPIIQTGEPVKSIEKKCEKNPSEKCETEDCCKK